MADPPKPTDGTRIGPGPLPEYAWVAVHRVTGLWSSPRDGAELFRVAQPDARFQVARAQDGPRLYVFDPATKNYAYINAMFKIF